MAAGRTLRGTRAQQGAASAQIAGNVGAAASVAISYLSPAEEGSAVSVLDAASVAIQMPPVEEGSVVSVFAAAPMCDFLQKTQQIRSVGTEPEQHAQLTELLGNAVRFSGEVRKFVVKACVIVVTEMLCIQKGEKANWVVTRETWAKVQENLGSMVIELPDEISLSHRSRFHRTCGVFCRVEADTRREIYARMLREKEGSSLRQMETDLLALLEVTTHGGSCLKNAAQNVEKLRNVVGVSRPKQGKSKVAGLSSESLQAPVPAAQDAIKALAGKKGKNAFHSAASRDR